MSEHYADQDQVDALKAWWKEYGTAVIVGVVAGALIISSFRYWNYYKTSQGEKASAIYEQLLKDVSVGKLDSADKSAKVLISDYTISPYPAISSLMLANVYIEKKKYSKAKEYLQSAINVANDNAMMHVARLRLARIIFSQEGNANEALTLIDGKESNGFSSQYAELKGDIYMSTGKVAEAANSYSQALAGDAIAGDYRPVMQMKLDNAKSKLP